MDPLPDFASAAITIVGVPGNVPEDVVVDAEGQIWTGVDDGRIVREGTPARLKADLRERHGLASDPALDDVFLDATGRTRGRVAGDVQEVSA